MFLPSQSTFLKDCQNSYFFVPICFSSLADFETPLSIFCKLKANFLLESVSKGDSLGRYSLIALGKKMEFSTKLEQITLRKWEKNELISTKIFHSKQPLNFLKEIIEKYSCLNYDFLPPFFAGFIGYLGYETVSYFEDISISKDTLNTPDSLLIFPEIVIVYDNVKKIVSLITLVEVNSDKKEVLKAYEKAKVILLNIYEKIKKPFNYVPIIPKEKINFNRNSFKSNISQSEYEEKVKTCIDYIKQGEIFQAVISQRFSLQTNINPLEVYRTLKTLNPSPYLYYLDFEDFQIVGSSPELMVSCQDNELLLRPIAGTRKRGKTHKEDNILMQELLNDKKEIAEHLMLVDLARNDLGKVAEIGSVKVSDYMTIEKYSHVQHIVSSIKALKKENKDIFDILSATFPAGTLSGAPKVRAMEVIAELEEEKRGPYGGSILYLGLNGNLNSCITIRTILFKDNYAFIQAGAGIVYDSVPKKEYQECLNKAKALMLAIEETYLRLFNGNNN